MLEIKQLPKEDYKDFFKAALNIYKSDSNWICPLNDEIAGIFNEQKNQLLKNGNSSKWVCYQNGIACGRIAAFWTEKKSKKQKPFAGGIAFFDCINSQEAANMLFDVAIKWLENQGMQAVDANTVPGENFNHWGILIDGFSKQGFGMPYNKNYYQKLFENYGFQIYFEQFSYHVDLTKNFPERHQAFAEHIINSGEFNFEHFSHKNPEKYISDLTQIFNDVWSAFHADYVALDKNVFQKMYSEIKPILNQDFVWFAYKDHKPVAMEICFPDINQIIKPFKGKLNLLNKIRFALNLKKIDRARLLVFGVNPDYHHTGLMQALFLKMVESLKNSGIKELEMSWVGDYNPKVNKLYKHLGNTKLAKTHATFRFMIDKTIPFQRFTNDTES